MGDTHNVGNKEDKKHKRQYCKLCILLESAEARYPANGGLLETFLARLMLEPSHGRCVIVVKRTHARARRESS